MAEALGLLQRLEALSPEEKALRCELEALAGNRERAREHATSLLSKDNPPEVTVRALLVAGREASATGKFTEGNAQFQRALAIASEAGRPSLIAFVLSRHIEALLVLVGLGAAGAYLPAYRRAALRAGDAVSLQSLHLVLAETEAKSGRTLRAASELQLSELHSPPSENILVQARRELARGLILAELGDIRAAYKHSVKAAALASTAGAGSLLGPTLSSVAHLQVVLGLHEEAARTISTLTARAAYSVSNELARRSSHFMLANARRDYATATMLDREFGALGESETVVSAHWFNLERIQYLLNVERAADAVRLGLDSIEKLKISSDVNLLERLRIATAGALATVGGIDFALDLISTVLHGPMSRLPEFIASTQLVSARIASGTPEVAFDHFGRAARIYGAIGHLVGRGEALHGAARLRASLGGRPDSASPVPQITSLYSEPPESFGRIDADELNDATLYAASRTLCSAAAMVDLASRPTLSGFELLRLVSTTGIADTALLLAARGPSNVVLAWTGSQHPDKGLVSGPDRTVVFVLGTEDEREISVVVRPHKSSSTRTTLLALQRLVASAASLHRAVVSDSERSAVWPEPRPEQQLGFVFASEVMLDLLSATRRVAASDFPVLITGETGTGKELLARAIHSCSSRSARLFLPFNCSAVSREMLDSQLFGYRRGAFTGAQESFSGVIRNAAGGTLMLDEIGEIGLDVQPKLLRFLESNEVHPLGEPSPINVDVRVVAATNANLEKLVEEGRFRADLFYRLNVVQLTIPPLRDRREEIPLLLEHFLDRAQRECGKTGMRIGDTAAEYLLLYNWPGNVRELANEVRRAVALAEPGAVLMPEHLSTRITSTRRTLPASQRPADDTELVVRRDQPLVAAVEHVERALIQDALRVYPNVEDAARALGLSRKGLYLKRLRLKLDQ